MYLDHFGLREPPFSITPHTDFFFAGANRGATLDALIYAITRDEGIVKVSGEVGSGKTMLCRMLLEKLSKHAETVYLATPSLSREDILLAIAEDLDVKLAVSRPHQITRALQEHLLKIYASGRQVIVMIDEAHAMPTETLEEIRLLSNLESNRHKLLHIVLFGQPELDERLCEKDMRQLMDRITHNFSLEPLRRDDISSYLMFRLHTAGYRGPDLFTAGAIRLLSKASQGLTRRINILADKCLLSAFAEGQHTIDSRHTKAAIRDAQLKPMANRTWLALWISGTAAGVATAFAAWWISNTSIPLSATPEKQEPAQLTGTKTPVPAAHENASTGTSAASQSTNFQAHAPEKPTLAERIAATEEWLKKTPDTHYFIQLLSTEGNNFYSVDLFLENISSTLDSQQIRVYRSNLSGHNRLGVIYGDYPTHKVAKLELAKMGQLPGAGTPYLRTVNKLK